MTRMKEHIGFRCSKCQEVFRGLDSFHGEYRISCNNVKSIQLCRKCLYEIQALCQGELRNLRGQIEREIEICQRQHRTDRSANAKRIAFEKVLDLIDNTVILNGYNERSGYNRDLSSLELEARRIIHGEFKINFEEQIRIGGRYLVDGLIPLEKNPVVLEFDGWRHGIEEQKERDQKKDATLSLYKYSVVRIPEKTIKDDKSSLRTSMLDALYGVKCPTKKKVVPMNQAATLTSTKG